MYQKHAKPYFPGPSSMRQTMFLSLFYTGGNWGSEKWNDLIKVAKLESDTDGARLNNGTW